MDDLVLQVANARSLVPSLMMGPFGTKLCYIQIVLYHLIFFGDLVILVAPAICYGQWSCIRRPVYATRWTFGRRYYSESTAYSISVIYICIYIHIYICTYNIRNAG
jgi:hypothetical protein